MNPSQADDQRLRAPLQLWDVHNAEAHVRVLADAVLRQWRARLDTAKREDLLSYLLAECWRISGLTADGSLRCEYFAVVEVMFDRPRWSSTAGLRSGCEIRLGPFPTLEQARAHGAAAAEANRYGGTFTTLEQRPRGVYDPERGLAFSTFSRRILSMRVVDWYRETFGDSRYGGHQLALSLDQLVDEWENSSDGAADSYLDRNSPGARGEFFDQLHAHVYDHVLAEEAEASAIAC